MNIYKQAKFFLIIGLFLLTGCTRLGPVKTELRDAYPKKNDPKEFQSPLEAILTLHKEVSANLLYQNKKNEYFKYQEKVLSALESEQSLLEKTLEKNGSLPLQPGRSYSFELESFCVHAGKERPLAGDGFRIGPIKGPASSWLPTILQKYKKSGVTQHEAQTLIWSFLSGTRFDELSSSEQKNILKIFPDAPIRFGNSYVEDESESFLRSLIPIKISSSVDKLEGYKNVLKDASHKYEELAEVFAPNSSRKEPIEMGWVQTKEGYFARVESTEGYSGVRIDLYVPSSITESVIFDPATLLAIPALSQRLAISANKLEELYKNSGNRLLDMIAERKLTPQEQKLIREHPLDAVKIATNMRKAFQSTARNFPNIKNPHNNEADAFRHFVWSAMNARDVGESRARAFAEAHEAEPSQPANERIMDTWNNEQGLGFGGMSSSISIENIEQEGKNRIRERRLKIHP